MEKRKIERNRKERVKKRKRIVLFKAKLDKKREGARHIKRVSDKTNMKFFK